MSDYNFINALYQHAMEKGSPSDILQLRDLALAQIFQGLGTQLVNSTVNGKTMSFQIKKSADELYVITNKAYDMFLNGSRATITFDFSLLQP